LETDYGLCIRNCTLCEFHTKEGCGLDYNGEPRTTFREAVILLLVLISIPVVFIILIEIGVLK
jgi:hypothetical protein